MTPEGKVKAKVKKVLEEIGCYYFFPATGGFGKSGVPDVIACIAGIFFGIECKAGGNLPTMLQQHNLKLIRENGGKSIVINEHNVAGLKQWIIAELKGHNHG